MFRIVNIQALIDYKKIIKKLRNEIHEKDKSLNSLKKIKKWYKNIIKKSNTKVIKINLSECRDWQMNTKNIKHKTNKFFKVEGIRVIKSYNREVSSGWDQPILTEPNFKGGILGLLRKEINGAPHYLINAKFEPGNYKLIQLSPTLQSTFSNISRAHKGVETRLLKYFTNPNKNKSNNRMKFFAIDTSTEYEYKLYDIRSGNVFFILKLPLAGFSPTTKSKVHVSVEASGPARATVISYRPYAVWFCASLIRPLLESI